MSLEKAIKAFLKRKNDMDEKERQGDESYSLEFMKIRECCEKLRSDPFYSTSEAEKACNAPKNRYKDIIPFDYCRVALKEPSNGDNDYINASFITSTGKQNYIAAQGPLEKTIEAFWSMVWDYNVRVIVMACQEYEGAPPKHKCYRYWNSSTDEELVFGKFSIKMTVGESILPDTGESVIKRDLNVRKDGRVKKVVQLHYTKWPDKFIPRSVGSILGLLKHMRELHGEDKENLILLHCSAGCGRTGTLVVVDAIWRLLESGEITEKFSIFDMTFEMRKQRMSIVQSLDQYVFVYEAVTTLFKEYLNTAARGTSNTQDTGKPLKILELSHPLPTNKTDYCSLISNSSRHTYETIDASGSEPQTSRSGEHKPKGQDIGFPNRVGKPRGPRQLI